MTSVFSTALIIIAGFIAISFVVLMFYSNHLAGCWLGVVGLIPRVKWGSN